MHTVHIGQRRFTALASFIVGLSLLPTGALADQILETHAPSMTSYLPGFSNVQNVRPLAGQRGVNLDGSLRAAPLMPMALAGNPFGEPWDANARFGSIRLDTGTVDITDVDLALPARGFSWIIGRTYNTRQYDDTDPNSPTFFDSDGYQGVNWFQTSQPELVFHDDAGGNANDMITLVYGADRFIEFAVLVPLLIASAVLFWLLVKALARLQMPTRTEPPRSSG